MRKITLILSLFTSLLFSISCSSLYGPPAVHILPENVKKIHVRPFINATKLSGIEVIFTKTVEEEIIRDGRLSLVNTEEEADVVLFAIIEEYALQSFTYKKNMSMNKLSMNKLSTDQLGTDQFKMSIKANVSLIDKNKGIVLWNESDMRGMCIYRDTMRDQKAYNFTDGMRECEAVNTIFNRLSRRIVRRAVK